MRKGLAGALVALMSGGAAAAATEIWFGSETVVRGRIQAMIDGAEHDVVCVMDRFADYDVAYALERAARRGRRVRVVAGGGEAGSALRSHLAASGVEVKGGGEDIFSRFLVVDGEVVITGSYPYIPAAAASPFADVVVIYDDALAQRYLAFFNYIYNHAK